MANLKNCRRCKATTDGKYKRKGVLCVTCYEHLHDVQNSEELSSWIEDEPLRVYSDFTLPPHLRSPSDGVVKDLLNKICRYENPDEIEIEYILETQSFWYVRIIDIGGQGWLIDKETSVRNKVGGVHAELEEELLIFQRGILWDFCDLIIYSYADKDLLANNLGGRHCKWKETFRAKKGVFWSEEELSEMLCTLPCRLPSLKLNVDDLDLFDQLNLKYQIEKGSVKTYC